MNDVTCVCVDEVVKDGKENGVTPLARQEQLGGLQLARNSRASRPESAGSTRAPLESLA